ncbi:hypothetical protein ACIRYZ_14735 [Kitasatospora sp. NPDC101155]|uniref:hypothetical protein n=1 Tax=Kitasatospora sp. NPDC101155 TaxID=3364097 RepID=UPI00382FA19B
MMTLAQEDLETAPVRIADCPTEVAENPLDNLLPVMRTHELLHDVTDTVPTPPPDEQRLAAARQTSARATTTAPPPAAATPTATRATRRTL